MSLMLRVANARGSDIADAAVRVTALLSEVTAEGEAMRRFHDLALVRDRSPLLLMSWLIIHPIDEKSPLHGKAGADWTPRARPPQVPRRRRSGLTANRIQLTIPLCAVKRLR